MLAFADLLETSELLLAPMWHAFPKSGNLKITSKQEGEERDREGKEYGMLTNNKSCRMMTGRRLISFISKGEPCCAGD